MMTKGTRKENGIEQSAGGKYQTNIIEFPLIIQMERIVREAYRIEKRSIELLRKSKSLQESMVGKEWKV